MYPSSRGVDVCIEGTEHHPECPHGPTLLFTRYYESKPLRQFYACSAYRDRKSDGCSFFQWADEPTRPEKEALRRQINALHRPRRTHAENEERLENLSAAEGSAVRYCHQCETLLPKKERKEHAEHEDRVQVISKNRLRYPSQILTPRDDDKSYAQYLFNEESVEFFLSMLIDLEFSHVLCIGCPTVHEAVVASESPLQSFLLDLDSRYTHFWPQSSFQEFNLFNCHFFDGAKGEANFKRFLKSAKGGKIAFFLDPPFGGLSEAISSTLAKLKSMARPKAIHSELFWVFPYFLEKQLLDACPSLHMLDYKIGYSNYPKSRNSKRGSHVRLFTSVNAEKVVLPASEGYRFCTRCKRYSSQENKHCTKCKACPSKDGRTYVHCNLCTTCVKPDWIHCPSCLKCMPVSHTCEAEEGGPVKVGCHVCGDTSHKRRDCPRIGVLIKRKQRKRKRAASQWKRTE